MEVSVKLVMVFFGIATGFRALSCWGGGGSVAIPGIHVPMGYFRYCGSFVLQPQCVACSVAGVIS